MELDHDTGRMDGRVRRGPFQGRTLSEMSRQELLELLADCRGADAQSVPVLEAFLDRQFGPDWREEASAAGTAGGGGDRTSGAQAGGSGRMTVEEAYSMLGLQPGADAESIKQAHRRLMMKLHPDHGGSDYIAAKLNEAKDLLLNS
jgi:DnaJ-domain-containing protein 1